MKANEKDNSVSRRSFLMKSSLAAAVPFFTGIHASGSDSLKIGVIGCGGRGTGAAMDAMRADNSVRIVALGDLISSRVKECRERLTKEFSDRISVPDSACFSGFDAYKPVIEASDIVIIANAAKFHPMHQMAAVQAGKHVFVEKPHAVDPAGAKLVEKACELAEQKGLSIVSGLQSRFHPGYQETMKRVHEGAIGRIVAIQETWLRPPYVLRERVPGMKEMLHQGANQYHFNWLSGDDVPQTLIHNIDRSSWALHNSEPIKAYGMGGRSTLNGEIYGNVFDHHSVVYQFPEAVRVYAICRTIDNCYNENSSLILGTKGQCDLLKLRITGENPWEHPGDAGNPYVLEHAALIRSIREGKPINSGYHMVRSTRIAMMGQFACYTGQEITWDQISDSDFYFPPKAEDCHEDLDPPVKPGSDGNYPVLVPGKTKLL